MSLKLRSTKDLFIIYQEKTLAIFQILFGSLLTISIGIGAIYLETGNGYFPIIFGIIFISVGFLGIVQLFKTYGKLEKEAGFIHLKAESNNLSLAPFVGSRIVSYQWKEIAKIILTKRLVSIDTDESSYCRNQIIFYFKPNCFNKSESVIKKIWEFSKYHIQESPSRHCLICFVAFPKNQAENVRNELMRFAPESIDISVYNTVTLDYKKKNETFES
jgi:hypothetical protein